MVDRIVPGTEAKHTELSEQRLGIKDLVPVPCEKFTMWVVEDKFIAGKPHWPDVIYSNEVEKFEDMKLMLLNGSHSLLAYLGGLLACDTIPSCKSHDLVNDALQKTLSEEFIPATNMPSTFTASEYLALLNKRWQNTTLGDKTFRVGSDGSTKLPQRITKPALKLLSEDKEPKMMALLTASWLACIAPMNSEIQNEICANMKDAHKENLVRIANKSESIEDFIDSFFVEVPIFSQQLANSEIFRNLVKKYRSAIATDGIEQAIQLALLST
jgi:fructuronate reductase